jgi:hypothetical protein
VGNKKRNALKHGANATEVMLWSERYDDYESLRAELYLEFSPSGSTEGYLVQTLLDLRWRRRRLECYEQIVIQQRSDRVREENEYSHHVSTSRRPRICRHRAGLRAHQTSSCRRSVRKFIRADWTAHEQRMAFPSRTPRLPPEVPSITPGSPSCSPRVAIGADHLDPELISATALDLARWNIRHTHGDFSP